MFPYSKKTKKTQQLLILIDIDIKGDEIGLYKKNACVSPSKYTQGHWTLVGTQRYSRKKVSLHKTLSVLLWYDTKK